MPGICSKSGGVGMVILTKNLGKKHVKFVNLVFQDSLFKMPFTKKSDLLFVISMNTNTGI